MANEKNPLISINIPTFNSEKTIKLCIDSIKKQTYENYEIVLIDSNSKDKTVEIAKNLGCKIIIYDGKLLGARYVGAIQSNGDYVLMIDSDQVLEPSTLQRCIDKAKEFDMLVLEEHCYRTDNWIEKLFEMDRKLIHNVKDFSPISGVMLPRFYKKELAIKAFEAIPEKIRFTVAGQDHAIIYFEAYKLSKKVSIISDAVKHIEPNTLRQIWKKFYRWGKTSRNLHKITHYKELLSKKERFRSGLFTKGMYKESFASIILLVLKGIPFKLGYYFGK